jgi:N-acetylglutamate synthase-like GNAT family acetyltransferase
VDFHVRLASPTDAEGIARVYVTSWNEGFAHLMPLRVLNPEQVARWSQDLGARRVRWWLAESGESVVGFVGTRPSRDPKDPDLGELDTIAVSPSAWRHGVGRRLMDSALDDLRAAGHREAILWTLADYEQGRSFYEATGWLASDEVRDAGRQIAFRHRLLPTSDIKAG